MIELFNDDCLKQMARLGENSVDAVVTDPPYGIRFMGKAWDGADIDKMYKSKRRKTLRPDGYKEHDGVSFAAGTYDLSPTGMLAFQEFSQQWATQALRILKPGGHLISFASCRTYHRMVCGIECAGFEIRDQVQWIFGSGFPKSFNLTGNFEGWGTALKPGLEPAVLARKPLLKNLSVQENVEKFGTGAINIKDSRIGVEPIEINKHEGYNSNSLQGSTKGQWTGKKETVSGRWPTNVILDEEAGALLDQQTGELTSGKMKAGQKRNNPSGWAGKMPEEIVNDTYGDSGGASRFYYCAKSSQSERNAGIAVKNIHPTVKPVDLMKYLIRLVTPPGGTVLDPFMGSGSTGVAAKNLGFKFIGCEISEEYFGIAKSRIESPEHIHQPGLF